MNPTQSHRDRWRLKPRGVAGRIIAVVWLAMAASMALAHESPVDHVDRDLSMWIQDGKLVLSYRIQVSERMAMMQLNEADANGDGRISDEERRVYFAARQKALGALLRLEFAGKPAAWSAEGDVLLDARLGQTYRFSAPLPEHATGVDGRLNDLFSREYPGGFRYRQSPSLPEDAAAVTCELESASQNESQEHPSTVVLRFKLPAAPRR